MLYIVCEIKEIYAHYKKSHSIGTDTYSMVLRWNEPDKALNKTSHSQHTLWRDMAEYYEKIKNNIRLS